MGKNALLTIIFSILLTLLPVIAMAGIKEDAMVKDIHWLGHDTFKIVGEKVIYTDPFKIKKKDNADIILITHEHYDHCSPEDVKKIQGPETVIVCTPDCAEKLAG